MRPRNIYLDDGQFETLQAIADLSEIGNPSVASLVRQAVRQFIERVLAENPVLKEKLEKQGKRPKLVPIRSTSSGPGANGER